MLFEKVHPMKTLYNSSEYYKDSDTMGLTKTEKQLLKKIAEMNLVTKAELNVFLKDGNNSGKDPTATLNSATRNLMDKELITSINPVGSTCFIITKNGTKLLQDMEE